MASIRLSLGRAGSVLLALWSTGAVAAPGGTAENRVETSPTANGGELRVEGVPAGRILLSEGGRGVLPTEVADGQQVPKLVSIDQRLLDAGYRPARAFADRP